MTKLLTPTINLLNMIKCNHYRLKPGGEVLLYGEELNLPDFFKAELIKEDIDPSTEEYRHLDLLDRNLLVESVLGKRTRDKVLEEEHITSFNDLSNAYFLVKAKALNKSRRVREFVEEKYTEVIELVKKDDTSSKNDQGS